MEILTFIRDLVDWQAVILVLSIGEVAKRLFPRLHTFRTVFFATLPFVVIYGWLAMRWDGQSWRETVVSSTFAYFVYPLIVKPIISYFSKLTENNKI